MTRHELMMRRLGLRDETGGMMPVMLAIVSVLLFGGVALFGVGSAATARAEGQTAADAAALAAARSVSQGLAQIGGDGRPPCERMYPQARASATEYASKNGGELLRLEIKPSWDYICQVDVWVLSEEEATRAGPIQPDIDEVTARGGVVRARAAAQGMGMARGMGGPGGGPNAGPITIDDPEKVAEDLVNYANQIHADAYPYVWGGGHGHDPVPMGLSGYDCSASVSMLLQHAGIAVPTMTSAGYLGSDRIDGIQEGPGNFLTIWTYVGDPGHVWVSINGNGWGTPGGPAGGPGWNHNADPHPHQFDQGATAYHFPELEAGLSQDFIDSLIPSIDTGGGGGGGVGPGGILGGAGVRLVEID